ncbi:hypothetical protein [uncultured Demequina sp.]|uniref:hypothetical protein n=1 Tax=uncultured Demequina sp. TaxID=693499 RepID=UPI0025EDD9E3|nr:hypothetical protein [uncultured Demequina sp.]
MDNARRGPQGWVWIAAAAAALIVLGIVVVLVSQPPADDAPAATSPSPESDACGGVDAQYIDLDLQIVQPESLMCFVLDERLQVTVGAAALEPDDAVVLTVRTVDGETLGTAASEPEWDPEVAVTLEPGIYVVEVTGQGGGTPPFLVYSATFAPGEDQPADSVDVPSEQRCLEDFPALAAGGRVAVNEAAGEGTAHYACISLDEAAFAKVGLVSPDPSDGDAADLQMALYRYDGGPVLVRSADDAIGYDPELSVDLEAGTYLVEATAWFDSPTGPFQFYLDIDGELFRHGEVTSLHADLTEDVCTGAPMLAPGDAVTVEGERTYVCATVPAQQRLVIEAATLGEQDLVLEVIGFEDSGTPFRLAWADEDPTTDVLADFDPRIDQVVPEGAWVIAVTTYFTGVAADYDIRLAPAER